MTQARSAKKALADAGFSGDAVDVSKYGEHGTVGDNYKRDSHKVEGFFDRLFGDHKDDNRNYHRKDAAREVASRGTVVTVHTANMEKAKRAAAILDQYGAIDLDDRYNKYNNNSFNADENRKSLNQRYGNVDKEGTIEVLKEDVAIGKRDVNTGSISVRSHIVERPVEETLRLRTEEAYIERNKVDRPATGAEFKDQNITVKETSEEAVVQKKARVVEEIKVGKNVDTRTEKVRETARETEVDIVKNGEKNRKHETAKR
ncbi:YsnF/AvaK domain-containing protein [Neolewinella litorea]|nr:YsnF/AvaK domain-containing protein [Neolewinella litorea]